MRTIAHLSDLHFGRLDPQIADALVTSVREAGPDLIALSGDFTQRARRREFRDARAFLQALPFPRVAVPGNHDVPLYDVARRFLRPLARYRAYIDEDVEPIYVDGEMVVIGLNTARSLTFGRGRLNGTQMRRATERLRGLSPELIKIIVTHHPFDLPETHTPEHLVGRAKMAMEELATVGADLFLAGHLHVSHIGSTAERYKIAGHNALVVQAGTISTRRRGEANSFNLIRLQRPHITVTRRIWDAERRWFVDGSPRTFRHSELGWNEEV